MQNPKLRVPWPRSLSQLLVKPGLPNSTVWAHNPPCYHLLVYSTDRLSSYYMPGTVLGDRNTDGLCPPGSYVLAGAITYIHLCTYKDIITLYLLWKTVKRGWDDVAQLGRVKSKVGMSVKASPENWHLSQFEEYRGVGQEKDIPGKMNCWCKGFQAGRYFTGHRDGKEACLDGEIGKHGQYRTVSSFWTLSWESWEHRHLAHRWWCTVANSGLNSK